ncbi:MAG: hypothetical protein LBI47_00825 [Puniceicoccales bacterium]|jgi:hypothetical protein|nr:hypothetical protein [Puniceicoccales bacterium]
MQNVNQTAGYETRFAASAINGWNTVIKPVLENYLKQAGGIIPGDIATRNASTVMECAKQASCFAMPLAKFMAGKVVGFCQFTWSLAATHPVISTALVLVLVIIPVLREYRAANEKFTLKALPVIAWMIITRPFRLVYRILMVITGGTDVDRQKLARENTMAQQRVAQSEEATAQSQRTIDQLKGLHSILRQELQGKAQAVLTRIRAESNEPRTMLAFVANEIFQLTDEIIKKPSLRNYVTRRNYCQDLIEKNQFTDIRAAFDEWKKCLDLCILTQ